MALFCSSHKGFYGFVRSQWVLVVTKPNSSLFIVQRNNEESGNHVVPVVIFLKDNTNHVFLTVLDIASSRAASLIPVFLIPTPLFMALGKLKSRFPGSILPPQSISEGAVESWDALILPDTPYPHGIRGATPPTWSCSYGSVPIKGSALQCSFMIQLLQLYLKIHLNLFHR